MNKRAIQIKESEFPHRNSAVSLALEAEIKRIAIDKGIETGTVITKLAGKTCVTERQIYNYRSGKTDIPSMMIPIFCKQFESNALAMAVVALCDETCFEEQDLFDISRFASRSVRDVLESHDDFLEAFEDGIDGHELSKLHLSAAKITRNAHRLLEVAKADYGRRHAAA